MFFIYIYIHNYLYVYLYFQNGFKPSTVKLSISESSTMSVWRLVVTGSVLLRIPRTRYYWTWSHKKGDGIDVDRFCCLWDSILAFEFSEDLTKKSHHHMNKWRYECFIGIMFTFQVDFFCRKNGYLCLKEVTKICYFEVVVADHETTTSQGHLFAKSEALSLARLPDVPFTGGWVPMFLWREDTHEIYNEA